MPSLLGDTIPQTTEVAIIGAGLGGLVTAVELARQGRDVCVFEKQLAAGGYAHNFRRKGFHFDVSLHHMGGFVPGTLTHGILKSIGVFDKLNLIENKTLFRSEFPGFSITLPNDKLKLVDILCKEFPGEAESIVAFFEFLPQLKMDVIAPTIDPGFNTPAHDRPSMQYVDRSYQQLLEEYFSDSKLKALLGQMWSYIGIPPSQSAANFSACVNSSAFIEGERGIVGGGAALVRDMVDKLRELGGECYTGQEVVEVVVEDATVVGVRLKDGRLVRASSVVAAVNPLYTFEKLVSSKDVSEIYRYRLRQMTPSLSMFGLYVGLNCPAKKVGIKEANYFCNHDYDLDDAFERVLKQDFSITDFCVHNGTRMRTSIAPRGCSIVTFIEPTPVSDWIDFDEKAYLEKKQHVQNILLQKYEQRFKGLTKNIEVMEFLTPRSFWKATYSEAGAVYGFAQTIEQSNNRRLRNRTPIKGLFLSGAWTWAGGGYEGAMASGVQTAKSIMDEYRYEYVAPRTCLHSTPSEHINIEEEEILQKALVPFDSKVSLDSHYRHKFKVMVYGDELNSRGNADANSYLKYLDRARSEAIEELCSDGKSWHKDYQIKIYRIVARCATIVRLADMLEVRTGVRRISNHRASFDQRIINVKTDKVVCDATVEVLFLDKQDNLAMVPTDLVNTDDSVPSFDEEKVEPISFRDEEHFPFRTRNRVYFEDTDLQAIMFHVSHVRYCERALFDLVQSIWPDVSTSTWMSRTNSTISKIEIRYLNAAVLGDRFEVRTTLMGMDLRKIKFGQRIVKIETNEVIADVTIDVEFRDAQGNYFPVPKQIADVARVQLAQMERQ